MSTSRLMAEAVKYVEAGLSVIPCGRDKKPLIPWEKYQKERASKKQVLEWLLEFKESNIGIVTGKISNLVVVDVDDIKMDDQITSMFDGIIPPCCTTPRGGKHYYFSYPEKEVRNKAGLLPKVDIRAEGGYVVAPPSHNGTGRPYAWVTPLSTLPPPLPEKIKHIIYKEYNNSLNAYIGVSSSVTTDDDKRRHLTTLSFSEGNRDESLFHIANCLVKGGMTRRNATYLLENIAQKFCEHGTRPYTLEEARQKVQSAVDRLSRKEKGSMDEIREWVMTTSGVFLTTDVHKELDLTTTDDKKKAVRYLLRLEKDGIIEKYGTKRGSYRTVDRAYEIMDYLNAPTDEFKIDLPLQLNDKTRIYPGNVIIVAGSKSAGKTAFMLNVVRNNMDNYKIYYMNSEMGDTELRKRLERFDDIQIKEWKFIPINRNSAWEDLITEEKAIFIIDYMEPPPDKPYMVAEHIKNIHFKLKNGICFIGLQKNPGRDTGRGDQYTLEKCRLALALDRVKEDRSHQAKIVECKSPRGDNPRGMTLRFECEGGYCKPRGFWKDES